MSTPFDLTIDSGGDQFAVTGEVPRLSWKLSSERVRLRARSTRRRICPPRSAARERVIGSSCGPGLRCAAASGSAGVCARLRLAETSDWSEWAAFEVGLLDDDWTASWISPVESADPGYGRRPAYLLATEFALTEQVRSARLYATALGVYTAAVNGERVGTAELSPGSTSYDRTLYAQASDVTASLRPGANRLEIELSDGWYRGQVGAFRMPAGWGTVLGARVELHIEQTDGTRIGSIRSDDDLDQSPLVDRPRRPDGRADGRLHRRGGQPDACARGGGRCPRDRLVAGAARAGGGVACTAVGARDRTGRVGRRLRPERLGVDPAERPRSRGHRDRRSTTASTSASTEISRPRTSTPSDRENPPVAFRQHDEVIAGPGGEVFEPRHTVHGFQYARLTRHGAPLDPAGITMQIVHTDLRRTGTFACSDDDLNRLHEIADWSFRGNAVDVPTDCPTRERLAWTGDYQIFAPTATRLYDVLGFSRKWLRSVRDDQLDDGRIANFSPDGRRIKHHLDDQFAMMTGSAGWGDAIVAVPVGALRVVRRRADPRRELGCDGPLGRVGAGEGAHRASSRPRAARRGAVRAVPVGRHVPLGRVDRAQGARRRRDRDRPDQAEPDGMVHGRQGRGRHRLPPPLRRDPRPDRVDPRPRRRRRPLRAARRTGRGRMARRVSERRRHHGR